LVVNAIAGIEEVGFLYILRCTDKDQIVKIGRTINDPHTRLKDYVKSHGLSGNWEVFGKYHTRFVSRCELEIHGMLGEKRVITDTGARELFKIHHSSAQDVLINVMRKYNDQSYIDQVSQRNEQLQKAILSQAEKRKKLARKLSKQFHLYFENTALESSTHLSRKQEFASLNVFAKLTAPIPIKKRGATDAYARSMLGIASGNLVGFSIGLVIIVGGVGFALWGKAGLLAAGLIIMFFTWIATSAEMRRLK